jgi:hypothetical protein
MLLDIFDGRVLLYVHHILRLCFASICGSISRVPPGQWSSRRARGTRKSFSRRICLGFFFFFFCLDLFSAVYLFSVDLVDFSSGVLRRLLVILCMGNDSRA